MLNKAFFRKGTAVSIVCVLVLIIVATNLRSNSEGSSPRSSNGVQEMSNHLVKKPNRQFVSDMEESRKFLKVYDPSQEIKENYTCVAMKVVPATTVCLHDLKKDVHVSKTIAKDGAWEKNILSEFKGEILKDDKLGVIDVGANIGVYSLYGATIGRKVISVEPFIENANHLHKAAILGGVRQNIVLLQNAVSNERYEKMLKLRSKNQGDTRVVDKKDCNETTCPPTIKTILLSDLRYVTSIDRAIMKIDCQFYEPRAFTTFEPLIDQISIPAIFMEWEFFNPKYTLDLEYELLKKMMEVLTKRGYLPYRLKKDNGKLLDVKLHKSWPPDIVWRRDIT